MHRRKSSTGRQIMICFRAAAWLGGIPAAAGAAEFTWTDVSGNWSLSSNWTSGVSPSSDAATGLIFGGSGTLGYTANNDIPAVPFVVNHVTLQSTCTGIADFAPGITGGPLQFAGASPT